VYVDFDSIDLLNLHTDTTKVEYIVTFFSTPLTVTGFILYIISSLACDGVLVSNVCKEI
jgi:hypothetical protein